MAKFTIGEAQKEREEKMTKIHRIIIGQKKRRKNAPMIFKVYNIEMDGPRPDEKLLEEIFCDPVRQRIIKQTPQGISFMERMYHGGVVDPAQETIRIACAARGITIIAAKISTRYYGKAAEGVFVNSQVEVALCREAEVKAIKTLLPRGIRIPMQYYDLSSMNDQQLIKLSKDRDLGLSLAEMRELVLIQFDLGLKQVTDAFLETKACRWSDHCKHKKWGALGSYRYLREATEKINNPNMVSAFEDNAGGWRFFDEYVAAIKLETHNSPTQKEPFGGQLTKLGGVIRDLFGFGLGAKPIGNIEMTTVGEFGHKKFPLLKGNVLDPQIIAQETIRAIAGYGNPMGIPMLLAKMQSHPNFGGKVFALGGTIGLTTMERAMKGKPRPGDLAIMTGRTGNDGLHGATISSEEMTEKVDTGDACHVQVGNPYTEQAFMRAITELYEAGCLRAINDFGAAGIVSALGEMAEECGLLVNLASVLLKCAGLANWQILISESQERMAFAIIPEKYKEAMVIFAKYGIEATQVGIFTDTKRFQVMYDQEVKEFKLGMQLSGEICVDVPYEYFDRCPIPKMEIIQPPAKTEEIVFPTITEDMVEEMTAKVVAHFDECNQDPATKQYDATVQAIHYQGPLYGRNYNVASSLAVQRPVYGKQWGLTLSQSFSPWQFEVDPVQAAINAMVHAVVTQLIAGVQLQDICLADNFYTPHLDKHAWWYLFHQVKSIADLSVLLGTPFITGKDSSAGSATLNAGEFIINVLCSVVITAMGKIFDVRKLILHQWTRPENMLVMVGPRAKTLSGSILSSALGITGNSLGGLAIEETREYMDRISQLISTGKVRSSVPISEGGAILRLFEGVEASGFGVHITADPNSLFTANFGAALLEVECGNIVSVLNQFKDLQPEVVGKISRKQKMFIHGKALDLQFLRTGWNTTFEKEVYGI
jgi:phosphoribosylformylglycinamidine synthase